MQNILTKMKRIPNKLKEAIRDNKVVLFLGAGISIPFGFPSWNQLIIEIIEKFNEERLLENHPKKDSLNNAKKLLEIDPGLGLHILSNLETDKPAVPNTLKFLDSLIKKKEKEAPRDYSQLEELVKISDKIITTNYDRLIEKVVGYEDVVIFDNKINLAQLTDKNRFVFKMHGCISNAGKCIFFKSQYEQLYKSDSYLLQLSNIILNHHFLFIGFSMTDPYVKEIFKFISKIYEGYNKNHFLISPDNGQDFLKDINVTHVPIKNYESDYIEIISELNKISKISHSTDELHHNNFEVYKNGKSLDLSDFLGPIRIQSSTIDFVKRKIDNDIAVSLKNKKSVIIKGKPLAGKTRSLFELFKKDNYEDTYIVKPKFKNINYEVNKLLSLKNKKHVFVFDDIDEYITNCNTDFNQTLKLLIDHKQTIICTIMTGPQYEQYRSSISVKIQEYFDEFEIGDFDISLIPNKQNVNPINFDGTLGSLLLPLSEMKNRFLELEIQAINDTNSFYALKILHILKVFFLLHNKYMQSFGFNKSIIKRYFNKKYRDASVHFEQALLLLKQKGFVSSISQIIISTEDVYLRKIILPLLSITEALVEVGNLLPSKIEKEQFGFNLSTNRFNTLLLLSDNQSEIKLLIERILIDQVQLNTYSYNLVINKSNSIDLAKQLWTEMDDKKIEKDTVTYSTYMNITNSIDLAKQLWTEMDDKKIEKSTVTYNTYMNITNSIDLAKQLWTEMDDKKIEKDTVTYNTYMNITNSIDLAKQLWTEMDDKKIEKDTVTYSTYMNITNSIDLAKQLWTEMDDKKIEKSTVTYSTYMNITNSIDLAKQLWTEMDDKKIEKSTVTYSTYMNITNSIDLAKQLWTEMDDKKIEKDTVTYSTYMNITNSIDLAKQLWTEMDDKKIEKSTVTYSTYMNITNSIDLAKQLWTEMDDKKIEKDTVTYSTYMNITNSIDLAKQLWTEMDDKKIEKDTVTYDVYLKLCDNENDLLEVLTYSLNPNVKFNFNQLSNKLNDFVRDDVIMDFVKSKINVIKSNDYLVKKFSIILEKYHLASTSNLGITLLDSLPNNSETLNIKANCYKQIDPNMAIKYYGEAVKLASSPRDKKEIYYNNICNLIIELDLNDKFDLALENAIKAMELTTINKFKYPFYNYFFLKIKNISEEEKILEAIKNFREKFGFNKYTFYSNLKKYPLSQRKFKIIQDWVEQED